MAVAAQVKSSKTLLELEIGADLGPAGMEPIGKAIAANTSLLRLSFADSAMGDSSFAHVVDGLRANVNVKELDLSGCALTDASGEAIGSIMRAHASRRAVSDWEANLRCYPGSASSKDLARAQAEGAVGPVGGLLTLNLSYNSLTTVSAKAMCAALKSDTRLQTISLKSNRIDEDGAARFGAAMREHPRLAAIELQGGSNADGVDLGILRVVHGSEVTMDHPEELDKQIVKKDVFMDMDCPPTTPRAKARRDAEVAAKKARATRRDPKARVSATAAGSAGWYEGRRGWSPASGVGAAKWERIGDHASSAKLVLTPGEASARAALALSPTSHRSPGRPVTARATRQTKVSPWAKRPRPPRRFETGPTSSSATRARMSRWTTRGRATRGRSWAGSLARCTRSREKSRAGCPRMSFASRWLPRRARRRPRRRWRRRRAVGRPSRCSRRSRRTSRLWRRSSGRERAHDGKKKCRKRRTRRIGRTAGDGERGT